MGVLEKYYVHVCSWNDAMQSKGTMTLVKKYCQKTLWWEKRAMGPSGGRKGYFNFFLSFPVSIEMKN
jgi:hypothetical protein